MKAITSLNMSTNFQRKDKDVLQEIFLKEEETTDQLADITTDHKEDMMTDHQEEKEAKEKPEVKDHQEEIDKEDK